MRMNELDAAPGRHVREGKRFLTRMALTKWEDIDG
jgi:hypothetical protein